MHRVHAAEPGMMRRSRCVIALIATAALAMAVSPALAATATMATVSQHASKSRHVSNKTPGASNRRPLPASKRAGVLADRAASAKARRIGRNVTVTSQTTATSMTVAHPNGTLTTTMYASPVRTRVDGRWTPISTRLIRTRSGWSPAAVPSRLMFSPGGTRALVTMTSPQGSLTLAFPGRLPAPVIRGGTATYRNALPGVSLSLTATTLGGVTLTFGIADADAAANPALRHLHLTVGTHGLAAWTDRTGNFAAAARGFGPVFSGPAAISWDSPAAARHHVAAPSAGAELHPALRGSTLRINPNPALLRPGSRYPAYISQSLTPDFPVRHSSSGVSSDTFNDTSTAPKAHFLETQQGCDTSKNYDISQGSGSQAGNAIGYNFWSSCIGIYRSYYSFDVSASSSAWKVISATLTIDQTYSADLTCGDKWPITAYTLGNGTTFGSGSDWSNYQPSMSSSNQEGASDSIKVGEPACADNSASFSVANAMQSAASDNSTDWSFGFRGNETKNPSSGTPSNCSTQNCGFSRWSNTPKIVTTFDELPPSPSSMTAVPTPTDTPISAADNGCGSTAGAGGWIGKTDLSGNGNTVDLKASFGASLASEDVQGKFNFWEVTPNLKGTSSTPGPSGYVVAPATISEPVGIALIDGGSYQWNAVATVDGNGNDAGKTFSTTSTDTCAFRVDETAPVGPTVSSSDFPPLGSVPGTTLTTGDTAQFDFSSYDPVPTAGACSSGGCAASGVYEFEYELNGQIPTNIATPTAAANCPATGVADGHLYGVAATNGGGTSSNPATATSCPIAIGNWGENTLSVAAVDNAGNISQTFQYHFYVPWSGAAPVAGDVNGDGYPDLLATASNGDLLLFPGRTDPTATPEIAGTPAQSPQPGTGWNNYQITHRGSFSQNSVDDLFALRGAILYRYLNNTKTGTTPQFENTANVHTVNWPPCPEPEMEADPDNPTGNCTGYPTGWSQISQIVAPGDAWVGANPFNQSTFGTTGITQDDLDPSLLAISKSGQLWLFQGNGGGQLQDPIQLGSSGWNNMTVIAPGTVNGTTVLWARDNSTGTLYSYPFVISANKVPTMNPTTPSSPIPAEGSGTTGTAISGAPTLTKAAYPTLTAALPLATGSGGCTTTNPGYYCAGLFAVDSSGNIWYYSGEPGTSPISSTRQLYFSALNPSGSWELNDGGACTTAADTSGNGNTGTINGLVQCVADPAAPATEPNPPAVDNFDGSTGYISTASPVLATGSGNSFSVSAWVYLTGNSQNATAVSQDTSASDSGGATNSSFELMYQQGSNSWAFSRPSANSSGAAADSATSALTSSSLNAWTQLTGTYNASTGLETLYVNGQPAGTATDTTPFASTGSTVIGRDLVAGTQSDFFPGYLKDVQVYNYSLSAAQAETLYQAPAASLPLDGPDSNGILDDATGDGYSATPAGGVTFPVDKYFGTVADFDGTSGYAETPASAGPVVDTTGSFTVSAWVNLPSIPTHNSTVVSEQGNTNSSFFLQYNNAYDGNNRWDFALAATDATGTGMFNAVSAAGSVQTNTWTQLTGVYNAGTGMAQLYVNGQLAASVAATPFASVGPLDIGRALWAGNFQDYLPGEVANVQAFSYALSPGAVQALYQGQTPISQIG